MVVGTMNIILKGNNSRTITSMFGPIWSCSFRRDDFSTFFPKGAYVKTKSADDRLLGWTLGPTDVILKGTTQ